MFAHGSDQRSHLRFHAEHQWLGDSGSPVVPGQKLIGSHWAAGLSTSMTAVLADLDARGAGAGFTPAAP